MDLRRNILFVCRLSLIACLAAACGRSPAGDIPVPRQHAYPRLSVPPAVYKADSVGKLPVMLNEAVAISSESPDWLTAEYKGLNTRIFITFTNLDVDNADQLIANRIERLSMNTGGAPTEVTETLTPNGRECTLLVTPSGSPTPVQFIAVSPGQWMLSGSGMIDATPAAPSDSLRPVVDMLRRDILHLLTTL